ncbi:tripartite motif-containing protein 16-like isoform X4 [Megalobrama amblycephala]|uniref:tripartite motif-containing protein 16-like isoform X4 n=1 Tax=Megalobrama amblycephala TaxID=75352 RepID=UPI002013F86C|nr:tripartite motif-containing protein 16-like isoform X4 [Megalobrama amblycephala]
MKFRVAVLLLLYKCLVFAPNVIFATESAVSGLTCPLKTCTDVLKELGATEKQLKDLEIRHAKSEDQIEEIKKEKQDQIEEIKKEKQDLEIRLAKCEAQTEEIKKEKQDKDFVPKTRNDFLQYSRQLTLDLNTVHKRLHLSEGNTLITYTYPELQSYPDHPDRFDGVYPQVLCRESVSDQRSYWEIEWSGEHVFIAVAYKSIRRKGTGNEFGANDQSWTLSCSSSSCIFIHNNIEIVLPVKPIISRTVVNVDRYRTGVYVDHSAGTLSFYSISGDTMTLFHTVQTTFTQPLYPGFRVLYSGSSVKLI